MASSCASEAGRSVADPVSNSSRSNVNHVVESTARVVSVMNASSCDSMPDAGTRMGCRRGSGRSTSGPGSRAGSGAASGAGAAVLPSVVLVVSATGLVLATGVVSGRAVSRTGAGLLVT